MPTTSTNESDPESNTVAESSGTPETGLADASAGPQPHGLCILDASGNVEFCNQTFRHICSVATENFNATTLDELLHQADDGLKQAIRGVVSANSPNQATDETFASVQTKPERGGAVRLFAESLPNGGTALMAESASPKGPIANFPKDELTQLANRGAFRYELDRQIKQADASMSEVAVLFLDLDKFKPVNDTLGHSVGDEALKIVADRLRQEVRTHDLIARLGGDEFAILQTEAAQPNGSRALARRIIDRISTPMDIDGTIVNLGVSIGVAIAPFDAENSQDLIRFADLAMYRAKNEGSNLIRYFEPEMESLLLKRRSIELQIEEALDRDEFSLRYQPLMDVESETFVSVEALIRWDDSPIPTEEFVAIAESSGLIEKIGAWVLRTACYDAAHWESDVSIAVNVSPRQLRSRTFFETVHLALSESGLPPERLELEITETVLLKDIEISLSMLRDLKELGAKIVMDDFGTGYSSINLLRQFPFDKIKIDRSFITGLVSESEEATLLQIIASLGTCLAIETTAEGVETTTDLEMVKRAGCDQIQGYLLSRPVKNSQLIKVLAQQTSSLEDQDVPQNCL